MRVFTHTPLHHYRGVNKEGMHSMHATKPDNHTAGGGEYSIILCLCDLRAALTVLLLQMVLSLCMVHSTFNSYLFEQHLHYAKLRHITSHHATALLYRGGERPPRVQHVSDFHPAGPILHLHQTAQRAHHLAHAQHRHHQPLQEHRYVLR